MKLLIAFSILVFPILAHADCENVINPSTGQEEYVCHDGPSTDPGTCQVVFDPQTNSEETICN